MSETIQSIIEWSRQAFPDATLRGQRDKFCEEYDEFMRACSSKGCDIMELADMFIVACSIGRFDIWDFMVHMTMIEGLLNAQMLPLSELTTAVQRKMEINRARSWEKRNGQYKHKAE